ncbi:MAG: hypothetical protein J6A75_10795 [Lachnospiraceae bacterium]|nr:hypothetical protein [Lachnospiraceae bacterium]
MKIFKSEIQKNQIALQKELEKHCEFLGAMTSKKWREKLPGYANREYETSFDQITRDFAKEMEKNISHDHMFLYPYIQAILENDKGYTAAQLLETVNYMGLGLKITHVTPDVILLNRMLKAESEERKGKEPSFIKEKNGVFFPSELGQKKHKEWEEFTQEEEKEYEKWLKENGFKEPSLEALEKYVEEIFI